jgi:hypothetical protein
LKNSLFKATGQERLHLRISTPGFTLWTQDIFQYETLHLLQSVSQQYSKKNSVAVRGPSRFQNTPMQYRGPTYSKKNSHAVRGPFLTPETSLFNRSQPRHLAKTLSVPLHWTSFYSRGHLFDTHEQFEYKNSQTEFLQRLKIYTLYINNI